MLLQSAPAPRTPLVRGLATVLAAGALATAVAVTPAAANDEWGGDPDSTPGVGGGGDGRGAWGGNDGRQEQGPHRGVVTADRLALHTSPTRGSDVIGYARRGEIDCRTPGDNVKGNRLWYLLADDTWAWGTARHIDNIGPAPRWR
jgi:hypothetical protein